MDESKYIQAVVSGSTKISTYSWENGSLTEKSIHTVGMTTCEDGCVPNRMYLKFHMPDLPHYPRIKKLELTLYQKSGVNEAAVAPLLGLSYEDSWIWDSQYTPPTVSELLDYAPMKATAEGEEVTAYTFDITKLAVKMRSGASISPVLALQFLDETLDCDSHVTFFGSTDAKYSPRVCISYESGYGVNNGYPTHTHEIGRFGQGSIDLALGNLMFECQDFAWEGNRMPITLKRLYNSLLCSSVYTNSSFNNLETADFSAMEMGLGWKLNVMQSMMPVTFHFAGTEYSGYVYIGENGSETYFKPSTAQAEKEDGTVYDLYEAVTDANLIYDPQKRALTQGVDTYQFDEDGRMVSVSDDHGNQMTLTYVEGQLTTITDGAGRSFILSYDDSNLLKTVTAPDGACIRYTYSDELLRTVTYPNGAEARISYDDYSPWRVDLFDEAGVATERVEYTHGLRGVIQYGVENGEYVLGAKTMYTFNGRSTIAVTTEPATEEETEKTITTVYSFDNDGSIIGEYVYASDLSNVGVEGKKKDIHPYAGGSIEPVNVSNNMLFNHSFENNGYWQPMAGNANVEQKVVTDDINAKFGKKMLKLTSVDSMGVAQGMYQTAYTLAGSNTFSMYVRVLSDFVGNGDPGVYLRVTDETGNVLAETEHVAKRDNAYIRLVAPFEINEDKKVDVQILLDGEGSVYADAAQLETNSFASAYNLLVNGDCGSNNGGWYKSSGVVNDYADCFNKQGCLKITGDLSENRKATQTVLVHNDRSTRETFTLSGWAKGCGLPDHEREGAPMPQFRLRAVVTYNDADFGETESDVFTADFDPNVEQWQHVSLQFAKRKYRTVQNVTVSCDFGYNYGTVCFDDIQLVRDSVETGLTAEDFVEEEPVSAVSELCEDFEDEADTVSGFEELLDEFGNAITETTFTDGEFGTIYRSSGFSENGNDLIRETDARGNITEYEVLPDTSQVDQITDRCGNKTAYGYDDAGRVTGIVNKDAQDNWLGSVDYEYDTFDNLTKIVRGDGLKYVLRYNAFHELESIGVEGKTEQLVTYTYKTGNGRLKQLTYANGDTMKASYNALGQMISEKWYDSENTLTAEYRYAYDAQGNIVRSVDILASREYSYTYEDGVIVRSTESDITMDDSGIITAKRPVSELRYSYDVEGNLTRKRILSASGDEQTIYYETTDGETTAVRFVVNGQTITSHAKTDSFGRKVFDELQLGTDFVSRQFSYHAGQVTQEHREGAKLKSSATTQLVSQIVLSDGRTLSYAYDNEDRIVSVAESREVNGETETTVTEYTYDAMGQLLTETVDGVAVNTMTYDHYGNILTRNGKAYTYGDSVWKDKLTAVDGKSITYDAQGNPVSYLGHTLTWEKGRQLKSFDGNTYTYNANGIRTSKTVNGVTHTYTLDGTNILKEVWGANTLIPLYDSEEAVCGIVYNGTPYYFLKDLQGDIIAILDANGETVATYSYDAWGVCTISADTSGCDIAAINPFRYRGYCFDAEIGMYYLQSRYYDPKVARFVNADKPEGTLVYRILENHYYAYCLNDPVNDDDAGGNLATLILKKIGQVVCGAGLSVLSQLLSDIIYSALKQKLTFSTRNEYISTAVSGAWDAIWGGGIVRAVCRSLLSEVLAQIVNMIKNKSKFDIYSVFLSILDPLFSYVLDKLIKTPKYLRDIKKKARAKGIKGLKKLTKYLNKRIKLINITKFTISAIYSAVKAFIIDVLSSLKSVGKDLFYDLKRDIGGMVYA